MGEELCIISGLQLLVRLAAYLLPLEFVEKSWYKDFIMMKWTVAPDSNGPKHRVHILVEMKQGQCICPLSWSVQCNFTGEGKCNERGVGLHPPPSPARTDFTLITECTPESSGCNSVYSVGPKVAVATLCTLWARK